MPFLNRANLLPSSFISRGRVTIPTIVKVVIKAATVATDAPSLRRDAARGKEIRDGICRIAPRKATNITPLKPACSPTIFEILDAGTKPKSNPIIIIIIKTIGRIRKKERIATIRDCLVFSLSFIKEIDKQIKANAFINKAVLSILLKDYI